MESKFGVSVGRMEWLEKDNSWLLLGINGQSLGQFGGIVASDKNIASPRFTNVTGRVPPLGKLCVGPPSVILLQVSLVAVHENIFWHYLSCISFMFKFSLLIVRVPQFDETTLLLSYHLLLLHSFVWLFTVM